MMLQVALHDIGMDIRRKRCRCLAGRCAGVRRKWRSVAERAARTAVLFCRDACLACCIANKAPGVRARGGRNSGSGNAAAAESFGANLLVVEMADRTYFECKELLRLL